MMMMSYSSYSPYAQNVLNETTKQRRHSVAAVNRVLIQHISFLPLLLYYNRLASS